MGTPDPGAQARLRDGVWSAAALAHAALLLVPVGLFVAVVLTAPDRLHVGLVFAGDDARWEQFATLEGATGALWLDLVFAVSVATLGTRALRQWQRRWVPARRRVGTWAWLPWAALAAGGLDAIENVVALTHLDSPVPSWVPPTVAAIGWWKLVAYAAAVVAAAGLVVGPVAAPIVRPTMRRVFGLLDTGSHPPAPPPATPAPPRGEELGIALSGGGIRAASVAIGALRALDVDPGDGTPSVLRRARWLTAVSGGAYAAGGWRITRRPGGQVPPVPTTERDGLFDAGAPWFRSVRQRRRYLDNGFGSLLGGLVGVLARTLVVLGSVAGAAFLAGWAAGMVTQSYAVHAGFDNDTGLLPARLVWPWLPVLVVGAVLVAVSAAMRDAWRRRLRTAGLAAMGAGAALATVLVLVPFGIQQGQQLLERLAELLTDTGGSEARQASAGARLVGLLTSLGIVSALVGVVRSQAVRRWLYLGGVALAVAWIVLAGKVADSFARNDSSWPGRWEWTPPGAARSVPVLALVALGLLALCDVIAAHRLTLGGIYRKRLAGTFALTAPADRSAAGPLPPLGYADEPLWPAYDAAADPGEPAGPELVIAATAHSSRREAGGVKGTAFTFRPRSVTLHRDPGADDTVATWRYPSGSWWDGYPRGWIVSRSMALTGAAFASAMGRQALGTTNALLAATNLRLGAWVPNPRHADWFDDRHHSPRVHLGYLAKEIFGRYHLDRDAFVYVADGGHRENLGLVELLRERPRTVVVVDASGDRPGTFATLREAIEVARAELGAEIEIDWGPIEPPPPDRPGPSLPADCVTTGSIAYADAPTGAPAATLHYGRYQLSQVAPAELLRFAAMNPRFPGYPTGDQFLTEDEFDHLVQLGEHVGARLRALVGPAPPPSPPAGPS